MKKIIFTAALIFASVVFGSNTLMASDSTNPYLFEQIQQSQATITYRNNSDYTMTLKILYASGGYYTTVYLPARSSRTVSFSRTNTFKLKIKAVHNGHTSYHKGGNFSVTCDSRGYTEGEMSFSMSTYGSGLGPSISAREFESNN